MNKHHGSNIGTMILALIKADPAMATLGLNTQTKQGSQGEYQAITICNYKEADVTL